MHVNTDMNLLLEAPKPVEPAPARAYVSYKQKLMQARSEYSPAIDNVSSALKGRLQKYYDALNGDYQYTDSHGKTVKARTYKKRLQLAAKELDSIQAHLQISRRYGKIDDTTALEISEYAQSLYNAAIKDNKYAKKHNVSRQSKAANLRHSLRGLEDKMIDLPLQRQDSPSGYKHYFHPNRDFRDQILLGLSKFGHVEILEPRTPKTPAERGIGERGSGVPYAPEKYGRLKRLGPVIGVGLLALTFTGLLGATAYFGYQEVIKEHREKEFIKSIMKLGEQR